MTSDVRARLLAAALAALPGWERWPVSEGVGLRRGRAFVRLTEAGDVVTVGDVPDEVRALLSNLYLPAAPSGPHRQVGRCVLHSTAAGAPVGMVSTGARTLPVLGRTA